MKKEIVDIIREASKMGAAEMLKALKPEEDRISQREAWRLFGMAQRAEAVRRPGQRQELHEVVQPRRAGAAAGRA